MNFFVIFFFCKKKRLSALEVMSSVNTTLQFTKFLADYCQHDYNILDWLYGKGRQKSSRLSNSKMGELVLLK